jgi:selenocysteine-specific elongation factor
MKQIILGTAGHIDHGKTSLIKALTDIDTDRLKEEKERGITIELGFAYLKLPAGQLLGIVDVPGHEKFVKNMVAGATGIDLVALIIAADEGIMPQTREHMEICELLGVRNGLVVLTKIDMVDDEWLELVKEDVKAYLTGTFLEKAPVLEVSSITGEGVKDMAKAIDDLVKVIPERAPGIFFRMPIDRVFTMRGFGTVVTGTTISGTIHTGDDVTIYPRGITSRIRGMQVHKQKAEQVSAGLRTAINLQGAEKTQIYRGDIVAAKDSLRSTYMVDVELKLLSSSPRKLKNRAKVRFHSGTTEIISTVVLLDRDELERGDTCYSQIRLDAPTSVLSGDRFILRSYSPVRTIGGGKILDPLPLKKKRFLKTVLSQFELLNSGTLKERVEHFIRVSRFQGKETYELQFLTNTSKEKLEDVLKELVAEKRITEYYYGENGAFIHAEYVEKGVQEIVSTLKRFHDDFPLKAGLIKEELRSRTMGSRNQRVFNFIISGLIRDATVIQEKELVRLKGHRITLADDQETIKQKIEDAYLKGGLQPPYFKEIKDRLSPDMGSDILELMVKEGLLIRVKEDLYFHHDVMDALEKRLVDFLKAKGEISTPQFKEMTGVSRKYTIPIIEYFDRAKVTVRVGDTRVLRKK